VIPGRATPDLARTTFAVLAMALLIIASLWIVRPFLGPAIWATMVVVATWPVMLRVQGWLRGKRSLAVAVMWLVMLVTPTPGGSGMAEYLFGELLQDFIRNGALALSLAFLWRLISYYPYLLIGSILLPRWLRKKQSA